MSLALYFFLNPAGHFGLTAVTFLVCLPLTQVIVDFFKITSAGEGEAEGAIVGVGDGCATIFSWTNFVFIVGCEKVKPLIDR